MMMRQNLKIYSAKVNPFFSKHDTKEVKPISNGEKEMSLVIREASESDIPDILEITREAFLKYVQDAKVPGTITALTETHDNVREDLKKKTVLVAVLDSKIVGVIRLQILCGSTAYISRFAVRLDVHNCGVGKELVKSALEYAKAFGCEIAALHTASKMTALIRLYYGLGFYIHSTATDRGYIRALLCRELTEGAEIDINMVGHL